MKDTRARVSVLTAGYGMLWGLTLGLWVLAPRIVAFYRLQPTSLTLWWHLGLALVLLLATLGGLLGFFGSAPLVLVHAVGRRPMRDPPLAYGLGGAFFVPVSYLATALGVEWINPGPRMAFRTYAAVVQPSFFVLAVLGPLLVALYRRHAGRDRVPLLNRALLVAALAGLFCLPLRVPAPLATADTTPIVLRASTSRIGPTTPLLFVGIDAGNWRTLQPLLQRGETPALARFVTSGLHGEVSAIWPPYWSAPAWAAILTGRPQSQTGIYEDLAAEVPGLPALQMPLGLDFVLDPVVASAFLLVPSGLIQLTPPKRQALRQPPFWELFSRAGMKTAVVRFRFTYPASGETDYVVSDSVGADLWQWLGVREHTGAGAVWPPNEAARLLAPFSRPLVAGAFAQLLAQRDRPKPYDAMKHPIEVLEIALRIDQQTLWAARDLLYMHPDVSAMAIYLGSFDSICHAFWQYRFPADFPEQPPDPIDVADFRDVIDLYWKFLDGAVADLIAAFPRPPNTVIVADHGVESIHTNPLWKGWHSARGGIFLAAGPDVPHREDILPVSYFDVVPTLAELAGFEPPAGLLGASLLRPTTATARVQALQTNEGKVSRAIAKSPGEAG
jgi:hypothetical protein